MKPQDFLGCELKIGDTVAFAFQSYQGSAIYLVQGRITGFTPANVRIEFERYKDTWSNKLVSREKIIKIKGL